MLKINQLSKNARNKVVDRKNLYRLDILKEVGLHYNFSNLYSSKCLKTILIDGSFIAPDSVNSYYKKRIDKIKSNEFTNENLELLFYKIIENVQGEKHLYNKKINK